MPPMASKAAKHHRLLVLAGNELAPKLAAGPRILNSYTSSSCKRLKKRRFAGFRAKISTAINIKTGPIALDFDVNYGALDRKNEQYRDTAGQ